LTRAKSRWKSPAPKRATEGWMEPDQHAVTWTRALLRLPADTGGRFPDEWAAVKRRIESVHSLTVPYDAEPAGGPRLESLGE